MHQASHGLNHSQCTTECLPQNLACRRPERLEPFTRKSLPHLSHTLPPSSIITKLPLGLPAPAPQPTCLVRDKPQPHASSCKCILDLSVLCHVCRGPPLLVGHIWLGPCPPQQFSHCHMPVHGCQVQGCVALGGAGGTTDIAGSWLLRLHGMVTARSPLHQQGSMVQAHPWHMVWTTGSQDGM